MILIDDSSLSSLKSRPSIAEYIKSLFRRRHFIRLDAKGKAFQTGRDTFLGKLWIVLDPLVDSAIYVLVFGFILNASRGIDNFIGFIIIGATYFRFSSKLINGGSGLIQQSKGLISAFNFPKASLVFAMTLRHFYDNLAPAFIAVILALLFQPGEPVHWTLLLIIPLYVLLHVFGLGIAFSAARMTAFIPDLKTAVSLLSRFLFFASGVFFSIDRFNTNAWMTTFVEINPLYQFLMAFRSVAMWGVVPSFYVWSYLALWSMGTALLGFLYFWRAEEKYSYVR